MLRVRRHVIAGSLAGLVTGSAAVLGSPAGAATTAPEEFEVCTSQAREMTTSNDGRFLYFSCVDPQVVKTFDTRTLSVVNTIEGLPGSVTALEVGPDGTLWIGGGTSVAKVDDPLTDTLPDATFPTASALVTDVAPSADGATLYLVGNSTGQAGRGVVEALDTDTGAQQHVAQEPMLEGTALLSNPTALAVAADGNVYVGGRQLAVFDDDLALVKAVPTAFETPESSGSNTISAMTLSPDGATVYAAAAQDLVVYDTTMDDPFRDAPGYVKDRITSAEFAAPAWMTTTPDGATLHVVNFNDWTRLVIDLPTTPDADAGITTIEGAGNSYFNALAVGANAVFVGNDGNASDGTTITRVPVAPTVDAVSLRRGATGTTVTVTGRALGDATVRLGSTAVATSRSTWNQASFTVPALSSFGARSLLVTTPSGSVAAGTFTVVAGKLTSATPKVKGKAKVGKRLTAATGRWTAGSRLRYAWLANGKPIKGATKASLKLTRKQAGKRIQLRVTGSKVGYATTTRTSPKTVKVKR